MHTSKYVYILFSFLFSALSVKSYPRFLVTLLNGNEFHFWWGDSATIQLKTNWACAIPRGPIFVQSRPQSPRDQKEQLSYKLFNLGYCVSRVLIGSLDLGYQPIYHATLYWNWLCQMPGARCWADMGLAKVQSAARFPYNPMHLLCMQLFVQQKNSPNNGAPLRLVCFE